jgi:hypothetical protein
MLIRDLMEGQEQRELNEWAESYVGNPEDMLKTMYKAWRSIGFSISPSDFTRITTDEVQMRKQVVVRRLHEFFGADVEKE